MLYEIKSTKETFLTTTHVVEVFSNECQLPNCVFEFQTLSRDFKVYVEY